MTSKDLRFYAASSWDKYCASVSEASKNDNGKALVESDIYVYNFDNIVRDIFQSSDHPCSADAITFEDNIIRLIEFKSGFRQKITKSTFDSKIGTCEKSGEVCTDYWGIFWENQDRKIAQLIDSIRLKAIESYIILEKKIFPCCKNTDSRNKISLTVVIDEDGADGIEAVLADAAGKEPNTNNSIISIKQSLRRLKNQKDANGGDYFYDEINICSASEYKSMLTHYE